jgi:EAL domain-containing protein (putative c-di-GMP-specific phosphodiesterase class I)
MSYIQFSKYSPAADIVVASVCLVMIVLVVFSYISRTRAFKLFLSMVALVLIAALTDIAFYQCASAEKHHLLANWLRCAHHAALLMIFVHYIAYIGEATHYSKQRLFRLLADLLFAAALLADVVVTAQGLTFYFDDTGIRFVRRGIFIYAYLGYLILSMVLLLRVRKLLFHRIMLGFYGTIAVSVIVLVIQGISSQSSFTVSTLMLPVIAMMYVLHSNPYDALLGANDDNAMQDYVKFCHDRHEDFVFVSLYMREFGEEGKEMPREMQANIRQNAYQVVKNAKLFKVERGHVILIFRKKHNPDYEQRIQRILDEFHERYEQYKYDYKIVIGTSTEEISSRNEYVDYIRSIHRTMPECSDHRVDEEDLETFNRSEYILKELADIYRRNDLDDPRVLVYCQPVLDVKTEKYDTAEALMRLDLPETGIVDPDQFIHLAEEQGYIHVLTQIILHKTCEAIRRFTDGGYEIKRISVNVSVPELKDEHFCSDILDIIGRSGIRGDKIAIELTESQNEDDFLLMERKLGELKQQGIKFYLDDFGTGYSSMERIMSLPFDTIKFDRSLVIASETEDRSRKMVENLANMFSNMDYSVLYEGVEKDADEAMCRNMSAAYLQGYKYSKPAPIIDLKDYLSKKVM